MSTAFAHALEEARGEIHLNQLAKAMAKPNAKDVRGPSGNLSRLQKGKQDPSKEKVEEIVRALASVKGLSSKETKYWRSRLMSAAGYGGLLKAVKTLQDNEAEVRRYLRPDCHEALKTVDGLKEAEIQSILDHVEVSTMKLIIAAAEKGEEIEVVQLQKISSSLQPTEKPLSKAAHKGSNDADTVIQAGRARILVEGSVSETQMKMLQNAAGMIESALEL